MTSRDKESNSARGEEVPNLMPVALGSPPLIVQTVFFSEADQPDAERIALDLYAHLTRSPEHPLAHGAGVPVLAPVMPDEVNLDAARNIVLLPVIGPDLSLDLRTEVDRRIRDWRRHPATPTMCVLRLNGALYAAKAARSLSVADIYTDQATQSDTLQKVVATVADALRPHAAQVMLHISYAPADSEATGNAALKIHHALIRQSFTAPVFDLLPLTTAPDPLMDGEGWNRMLLAVVGDAFSRNHTCTEQVLAAKRAGYPILTVLASHKGESRESSIMGNMPGIVWRDNPDAIALYATIQWIKARLFRLEAERALKALQAPKPRFLNRPPEVLDFVIANQPRSKLLMYPDPPLSIAERRVLSQAHRRLHLLTPTTAYGYLKRESEKLSQGESAQTPLDGRKVGMSISSAGMRESARAVAGCQFQDVVVQVTRTLLSAGAQIAYGGMLKQASYTALLAELADTYARSGNQGARLLSFLSAREPPVDDSWHPYLDVQHMAAIANAERNVPPPEKNDTIPAGLYYSDLRRFMCKQLDASVVFGGADRPRLDDPKRGYIGRYPGVVEEAWRMLMAEKPVYVVGGFGGAAGMVAQLMLDRDEQYFPKNLSDDTWLRLPGFLELINSIDKSPYHDLVGLPLSSDALAEQIRMQGRALLSDEDTAKRRNGLSIADNLTLLTTRDPLTVASLVFRGLCTVFAEKNTDDRRLKIELVRGSVLNSSALSAVSVAVAHGVPIGGAAADINELVSDRLQRAVIDDVPVIEVRGETLAADFVHLAKIHGVTSNAGVPFDIRPGVKNACLHARRLGFSRLGVVLYGASLLGDAPSHEKEFEELLRTMVETFTEHLPHTTTLVLHEIEPRRFELIRAHLESNKLVALSTVDAMGLAYARRQPPQCLGVHVTLSDDDKTLNITVSPPDGTAIVAHQTLSVTPQLVDHAARGLGAEQDTDECLQDTPRTKVALWRGEQLASALFGARCARLLAHIGDTEVRITHNVRASRIPFELLSYDGKPITSVTRRLTVSSETPDAMFVRRPTGTKLNVLVIADPGGDLDGADKEGHEVSAFLKGFSHVNCTLLRRDEATIAAVLKALPAIDILHYCGHGFFDEPGDGASGVELAHKEWLCPEDLANLARLPIVAIFNACQGAKMRSWQDTSGSTFAGHWLVNGLESYISTTWLVDDNAGLEFSKTLYEELLNNKNLRDAVQLGRRHLYTQGYRDWCNYVLYGSGSFRLLDRV